MIQLIFFLQKIFNSSHRLVWVRLEDGSKVLRNLPVFKSPEL